MVIVLCVVIFSELALA
jgi:hypothetical protein